VTNTAEAATQALRDGMSRARQMVWDAKGALEGQRKPDGVPTDSNLLPET